ncbi:MAG: response regulator transcription factor [Firmicutes bacterium]|nr:response regulator transcription factor [Bacillota bacterium]
MAEPIRIVVIEDQALVREALVALLQLQAPAIAVVGQASGGHEGLVVIERTRPDVALVDIQMPDGDGITATDAIRQQFPATRCLLLTTFAKDAYLTRGLEAGARGYVLKDTPVKELVDAISAVAENRLWISPAMQIRWNPGLRPSLLTEREHHVLQLAATGMTNRQIADQLFLAEGSVKNLWTEMLQKLQAKNRVEAIAIARSRGLID